MAYLNTLCESASAGLSMLRGACGTLRRKVQQAVPGRCPLCEDQSRGGSLCEYCRTLAMSSMLDGSARCPVCCLRLEGRAHCPDCLHKDYAFDRVIAALDYVEPGDLLIHYLKRRGQFMMAGVLADLLADAMDRCATPIPSATILVSVPASRVAVQRRGFNPAAEIARSVSWRRGLIYKPDVLRRTRDGASQTRLNRHDRGLQARGLYRCQGDVAGRHIAVVDDVLTTGSTLHSIALALKAAGATSVCGLVVARTPY